MRIAVVGIGHTLDAHVGALRKQVQDEQRSKGLAGAHLFGARVGEEAGEIHQQRASGKHDFLP
jgi:hypothetical protein